MATSEIVVNDYPAAALRLRYKSWQLAGIITCENTNTLVGFSDQRPDLVVRDNPLATVSVVPLAVSGKPDWVLRRYVDDVKIFGLGRPGCRDGLETR